jgi:hypothetical protein
MNDEMHPKFILITATSGMYSSLKSLPKPPSVLSASRTLRCTSADDIYPIGVKWSPFLTPGISRKNSNPLPFFKRKRPVFTGVAA